LEVALWNILLFRILLLLLLIAVQRTMNLVISFIVTTENCIPLILRLARTIINQNTMVPHDIVLVKEKLTKATLSSIQAEQKPKSCLIRCVLVTFFVITFFQAIKILVFLVCRTTSTKRNTPHVTFLKITLLLVVLTPSYTTFRRSFAKKETIQTDGFLF